MSVKFNKAHLSAMLTKQRVDDLCLLLPHIAKAVGEYNRQLKRQGVDKATRGLCVSQLSNRLFTAPAATDQSTDNDGGECYE